MPMPIARAQKNQYLHIHTFLFTSRTERLTHGLPPQSPLSSCGFYPFHRLSSCISEFISDYLGLARTFTSQSSNQRVAPRDSLQAAIIFAPPARAPPLQLLSQTAFLLQSKFPDFKVIQDCPAQLPFSLFISNGLPPVGRPIFTKSQHAVRPPPHLHKQWTERAEPYQYGRSVVMFPATLHPLSSLRVFIFGPYGFHISSFFSSHSKCFPSACCIAAARDDPLREHCWVHCYLLTNTHTRHDSQSGIMAPAFELQRGDQRLATSYGDTVGVSFAQPGWETYREQSPLPTVQAHGHSTS